MGSNLSCGQTTNIYDWTKALVIESLLEHPGSPGMPDGAVGCYEHGLNLILRRRLRWQNERHGDGRTAVSGPRGSIPPLNKLGLASIAAIQPAPIVTLKISFLHVEHQYIPTV
jgi:hypothetical protein